MSTILADTPFGSLDQHEYENPTSILSQWHLFVVSESIELTFADYDSILKCLMKSIDPKLQTYHDMRSISGPLIAYPNASKFFKAGKKIKSSAQQKLEVLP